ncbi:NADP-dependent succinic semialdehyde dehydrogenase [Tomitella fengzijianii]|uniref:NADP-dependent succinic semialdehyde dehydrogenase n=1 Tax=Tomitella fengzijianii TaxID=2597660 RepID=A0A516X1B4_9ACTN|nr:NADP-dependent succinic semialdehyde dehydrogenase [Tomitella fengzijianii]QDQ96875.1 NADP-dependent succinic semialdehyde dehydrogenase [Tomitella fengzijianii]
MSIATINPTTGELVRKFDEMSADEVERRIALAHDAYLRHRLTGFDERARLMRAAADLMDSDADELSKTMTVEMGKTRESARGEIAKCTRTMRYYADNAGKFLADAPRDSAAVKAQDAYVKYLPIGPVLAVMPWNFPLWQVVRFAAPALMAGNVGLLKHASNVPQCAQYLGEVFTRAGFEEGCFQTLLIGARHVEAVLRDPRVQAATLTGSEPAGRSVASIAGDEIKHTVLELGGSDPFVVMPSADIDRAVKTAVFARTQNNGQSCIGAKRFIVHADVYEEFSAKFVAGMDALRVGDPMEDGVDVGPLATEQGRKDVEALVDPALAAGAKALCGGKRLDGAGWFYPPTVITDITEDMDIYRQEVFGPVASLYKVADIDEAVSLANVVDFGLGAVAWTEDADERARFIRDLEAGAVTINGMTTSYPELPFGGVKRSGYGRELHAEGIREFCNAKTVWVGE